MKGKVLGPVAHFFYKKEYQGLGAPHYHILLWIEDAPIAGRDDPEDVLQWIENRITCRIPEEDSNPELHQLVTKYQRDKDDFHIAPVTTLPCINIIYMVGRE